MYIITGYLLPITSHLTSTRLFTIARHSRLEFEYRVSVLLSLYDKNMMIRSLSAIVGVASVPGRASLIWKRHPPKALILASVARWYCKLGSAPAIAFVYIACLTLSKASCYAGPQSNMSFSIHFLRIVGFFVLGFLSALVKSWSHSSTSVSCVSRGFGSSITCLR